MLLGIGYSFFSKHRLTSMTVSENIPENEKWHLKKKQRTKD